MFEEILKKENPTNRNRAILSFARQNKQLVVGKILEEDFSLFPIIIPRDCCVLKDLRTCQECQKICVIFKYSFQIRNLAGLVCQKNIYVLRWVFKNTQCGKNYQLEDCCRENSIVYKPLMESIVLGT